MQHRFLIIVLAVLLAIILWSILRLWLSMRRKGVPEKKKPAGPPQDEAPEPVYHTVDIDSVREDEFGKRHYEMEYEPDYFEEDPYYSQEPDDDAPPLDEEIGRDFWDRWDRAASSEDGADQLQTFADMLVRSGIVNEEQAAQMVRSSEEFERDTFKEPSNGIFHIEYEFPPEPRQVTLEY